MPTYVTPGPIDLALDIQVGRIDVVATDRADTVVSVTPSNPERPADVRGAEQTTVEFDGTRVTVAGYRRFVAIGANESIAVRVELPAGSRVTAEIGVGPVQLRGQLGATRIKSGMGDVDVESCGDLWAKVGHGPLIVGESGSVEATVNHGNIRIARIGGDARLKAAHGTMLLGEAAGDLDANLAYGDFELARGVGSVSANTAYGAIRVGEVSSGSVDLNSSFGSVSVGIAPGVSAWLDLATKSGRVHNELREPAAEGGEGSVAVRARTQHSDITVHRAA